MKLTTLFFGVSAAVPAFGQLSSGNSPATVSAREEAYQTCESSEIYTEPSCCRDNDDGTTSTDCQGGSSLVPESPLRIPLTDRSPRSWE